MRDGCDVLLRRTDLAAGRTPDDATVEECARIVGRELRWDERKIRAEIAAWEKTIPGCVIGAASKPATPAWTPAPPPAPVG